VAAATVLLLVALKSPPAAIGLAMLAGAWVASERDMTRTCEGLVLAGLVVLLISGIVAATERDMKRSNSPTGQWDACAENFKESARKLATATGQPPGDLERGAISACGQRP
jgi:hypothetical protein